jgi:hypothetical protein
MSVSADTALALALDAASRNPRPDDLRLADRCTIRYTHD